MNDGIKATGVTAVVALALAAVLPGVGGCSGADEGGSSKTGTGTQNQNASSSSGSSSGSSGKTTDKDKTDPAPAADAPCVPEGSKANDKGVGAYCTKGSKCAGDSFCTGDFGAPVGAQFCTIFCDKDEECGAGAHCYHEARGSACVMNACMK